MEFHDVSAWCRERETQMRYRALRHSLESLRRITRTRKDGKATGSRWAVLHAIVDNTYIIYIYIYVFKCVYDIWIFYFSLWSEESYHNVRIDSGVNLSDQTTRRQTYVRHHVAHGLLHSKRDSKYWNTLVYQVSLPSKLASCHLWPW